MAKITKVVARQVFDSRGFPTIETEVFCRNISSIAILFAERPKLQVEIIIGLFLFISNISAFTKALGAATLNTQVLRKYLLFMEQKYKIFFYIFSFIIIQKYYRILGY